MNEFKNDLISKIPSLIEHTHLNLSLDGWPATFAIWGICGTIVSVVVIVSNNNQE